MTENARLTPHPEGVVLLVRALPGSKSNGIRGVQDGALKVSVTQIPEKGKANKVVRKVLADALGLRASQLELIAGETTPLKKFLIRDAETAFLQQKIDALTSEMTLGEK